jgi:hypothetical protein
MRDMKTSAGLTVVGFVGVARRCIECRSQEAKTTTFRERLKVRCEYLCKATVGYIGANESASGIESVLASLRHRVRRHPEVGLIVF